jgi:hypothetical protein
MKIAVMLTGFLRSHLQCWEGVKKYLLDRYDCDLYCGTWDTNQLYINQPYNTINLDTCFDCYNGFNFKHKIFSYSEYNRDKSYIVLDKRQHDVFTVNTRAKQHGIAWAERLRDQWWLVQKTWNLIENGKLYDKIIRLRFDLTLHAPLDIIDHNFVIPQDIGGWSFSDHCAYGSYQAMSKYCNLYTHIPTLYYQNNIDISHAVDMLEYYMTNFQTPVHTYIDTTWKYGIVK